MSFIKIFHTLIFFVCCISQTLQSHDILIQNDKTELMNYVIQQEKEISSKKSILYKLANKYFTQNRKTGILEKNIWTTDDDIIHYRYLQDEIENLIKETIEHIKIMALQNVDLQARDLNGKSVRDYCKTYEINNTLRDLGAPISLQDQFYITCILGIITIPTLVFINGIIYKICYSEYQFQ